MKKFMANFEEAFHFVKQRREIIDPNEGFIKALKEFENHGN